MTTTASAPPGPKPAQWLLETLRIRPAAVPWGHAIRSGLAVGLPFIIGSLTDNILNGMWIGLATLLLAAGEREGTYRLNFWIILVSTPIAACGYFLGFAQDFPLAALIILVGACAFGAGAIAGLGPAFSVAGMQFLLVASIAIGVPHINWWVPFGWYFVGGAIYALLLAVEMWVNPRRPQRIVLVDLLRSTAALADARLLDLDDGGDRSTAARRTATGAYQAAAARVAEIHARPSGSARLWHLTTEVTSMAEHVQTLLLAEQNAAALSDARDRLLGLADAVANGRPGRHATPPQAATPRVGGVLATGITELSQLLAADDRHGPARERLVNPVIGNEVIKAATRLALCMAIAVGAKVYFPFNHWFWVPLTVCLVMKPDFGSVFGRAILRVIGTIIGAGIATLVIMFVPKGWAIGVAIGVLSACVPWFMMRTYALQAVAIAPAVILLVDVISPGDGSVNYSLQRIGATAVGGVVVLVFGYLIWPHSRRAWVAQTFSTAMRRIAGELRAASAATPDDASIAAARRASYHALSDLRTRLQRAVSEAGAASRTGAAWIPAVATADRLADDVAVYAAERLAGTVPADHEEATSLAERIEALGNGRAVPAPADAGRGPLSQVDKELTHLQGLVEAATSRR